MKLLFRAMHHFRPNLLLARFFHPLAKFQRLNRLDKVRSEELFEIRIGEIQAAFFETCHVVGLPNIRVFFLEISTAPLPRLNLIPQHYRFPRFGFLAPDHFLIEKKFFLGTFVVFCCLVLPEVLSLDLLDYLLPVLGADHGLKLLLFRFHRFFVLLFQILIDLLNGFWDLVLEVGAEGGLGGVFVDFMLWVVLVLGL